MARRRQQQQTERLFDPNDPSMYEKPYDFTPASYVHEGAQRYATEQGLGAPEFPHIGLGQTNERGELLAAAYVAAMENPKPAKGIEDSYKHATEHIRKQYEFMTRPQSEGGLGITHQVVTEDPYPSAEDMAHDVLHNRNIRTYATATTAGGDEQAPTNQAFDNETNDMLRAVHDVFGHAATGRGFTRHGEEAAYQYHRSLFPKEAHDAMTSELRGQNAFLNYSRPVWAEKEFPDPGARMIGLPKWASTERIPANTSRTKRRGPKATPIEIEYD